MAALSILLCGCLSAGVQGSCGPAPETQVSLNGAAAVSPDDVWAVGMFQDRGPAEPLTEHWDGRRWTTVAAPAGQWTESAYLSAVAAVGPGDLWAVGAGQRTGTEEQTLIEHWDGAAWTIVPSPNVGDRSNHLAAIDTSDAHDVWAVGSYTGSTGTAVLTEHWDGRSWTAIAAQNPAAGINALAGVSATSATDVWAVGTRRESDNAAPMTLIEHWDGSQWVVVPSASPGRTSSLSAVAALSTNDVWAVGSYDTGAAFIPLFEHWDGHSWTVRPGVGAENVSMQTLAGLGGADVWAAGASSQGHGDSWLIQHWDGEHWAGSSAAPGADGIVGAILPLSPSDVWAFGTRRSTACGPDVALIQRWDGHAWRAVASPHDAQSM